MLSVSAFMANASNLIMNLAICFLLYLNGSIFHSVSAILLLSLNIILISLTNFSQSQIFSSSFIQSNFFQAQIPIIPPLRQIRIAVILLSIVVTLLLLRNNCILLYQSLNFVQSLLNYSRSKTILLDMTICLLYTTEAGAIDIMSTISIVLSEVSSLIIFNDSNYSNNISYCFLNIDLFCCLQTISQVSFVSS